jgi:hypothetical protein
MLFELSTADRTFRPKTWLAGVLGAMMAVGCADAARVSGKTADYAPADPGQGQYPQQAPASEAAGAAPAPPPESADVARVEKKAEPSNRPGLGTTWGETRSSTITTAPFVRADATSPFATAGLFYNDEQGARAMANASGFRRMSEGSSDLGGGVATVRLKDESSRFLSGFEAGGKKFVIGTSGARYTIVVQNNVPARLEVVVSVDGLDVLDGKDAAFSKRGYLIEPNGVIEIDGFRQSMNAVAAFRFGSVRDSYAEKKEGGSSRNVGVIGVALFNERGSNPSSWQIGDTKSRLDANPFPGQFATPPKN